MEGEEEDLDFSESDFDGSISDDSLTDEDGLRFEQEQAEMLGLSPAKQVSQWLICSFYLYVTIFIDCCKFSIIPLHYTRY